jgi:uncharacterized protein YbaR (Trm112 family)
VLIELVDDLRCPRPHEETWLVASADRTVDRDIVDGTLGCPICHAEYPIRDGVVWFDDVEQPGVGTPFRPDAELAMRIAALLDLSDAHGFALLAGSYGPLAALLRGVVPPHLVVLNPSSPAAMGSGISGLVIRSGIPLADATCRGVALDAAHADAVHLDAAVRVLQAGGRLVVPATVTLPAGVTELARDDQLSVAERGAAPPKLVSLRGRGG